MPVEVVRLHPRGGAGVQPTGAGCAVVYWQNFILKIVGLNAILHPLNILVPIARLFKAERHLTQCRSGSGVQLLCVTWSYGQVRM